MANSDYRVSLKFSEKDEDQEEVIKLLKQMGRKKSAFITKAVKYYLSENPNAIVPEINKESLNKNSIKVILKELLSEMNLGNIQELQKEPESQKEIKEKAVQPAKSSKSIEEPVEEKSEEISDEQLDDFLEGLEVWDKGGV